MGRHFDGRFNSEGRTMADATLACGHKPSPHGDHTTGTGYGADGVEVCWDCCNVRELTAFLAADKYCAYLSGDGKSITTWPGGLLARVTWSHKVRHGFCGQLTRFDAVASDGSKWYGTSPGNGMYCRLRRRK